MKVQSVNCLPMYSKTNCTNTNFEGKFGKLGGGVAGGTLLTAALLTTSAISGPLGWALAAWVAAAGTIGGAAAGNNIEDKINELKNKSKGSSSNNLNVNA